jgi:Ca-activated chloride channel homolog
MTNRVPIILSRTLLLSFLSACNDVRIGRPDLLWVLWLIPVVLAFTIYSQRQKQRLLDKFISADMFERIHAGVSAARRRVKVFLILLGLTCMVLSLAQIKYGFSWEDVQREGVDIVVALDVSDSMLVEDAQATGKLTRLERAKREITDLLRMLDGDRIGLVAFAGQAFIECPLTLDYGAAEVFLEAVDIDLIPVKGTALGDAIDESLKAFEGSSHDSKAIILITDGEDHSGEALKAAQRAKRDRVKIFPIGIGRDSGSPIPKPGGGFRRDRQGEIIISSLDEPTLQKMALTTGGRYVRSVTGDMDLEKIYIQGIKATLTDRQLESTRRQHWEERFQFFLAIAIIALTIEPLIAERRRRIRLRESTG